MMLIDKDKALTAIADGIRELHNEDSIVVGEKIEEIGLIKAFDIIKRLPCVESRPKDEWIPCSERLPTLADGRDVLVNVISDDRVYDIILADVETVETVHRKGWINAWMPLPQPYRGDDHETD